jgi:hypothetical protein
MDDRLEVLLEKIRLLEAEVVSEVQKKQQEFTYKVIEKKVQFEKEIRSRHREQAEGVLRYLYNASNLSILTAPVIWFCLVPALFMDLVLTVYQKICFPIYGIPPVRRGDFIVLDRQYLDYLNVLERLNCYYCGYFNGVVAYVEEIAARTEQYWCPIKHARKVKTVHSRYHRFLDYGDAKGYLEEKERIRAAFEDLKR